MEGDPTKENLKTHRLTPDAVIDFLKENNAYDPDDTEGKMGQAFREANKKEGATYNQPSHPLFNSVPERYKDAVGHPRLTYFTEITRYLKMKRGQLAGLTEKDVTEIRQNGPYSHGGEITSVIGDAEDRMINFRNLPTEVKEQIPLLIYFVEHGHPIIHDFQKLLVKIDDGKLEFPEFEKVYLDLLDNYLGFLPRFLTLLARDPNWDPRELEEFIKDKKIPDIEYALAGLDFGSPEYNELMGLNKKDELSYDEKAKAVKFMEAVANIFEVMRKYLEAKVQYHQK